MPNNEIFESLHWDRELLKNRANIVHYKKMLLRDEKLGTTPTEQLFSCLQYALYEKFIKEII